VQNKHYLCVAVAYTGSQIINAISSLAKIIEEVDELTRRVEVLEAKNMSVCKRTHYNRGRVEKYPRYE